MHDTLRDGEGVSSASIVSISRTCTVCSCDRSTLTHCALEAVILETTGGGENQDLYLHGLC